MKSKITALITATILILSLAGCNGVNQEQTSGSISTMQEQSMASTSEQNPGSEAESSSDVEPEESSQDELSNSLNSEESEPEGTSTLVVFFSRHGNSIDGVDAVTSATLSSNDVTILADMIVETEGEADLHQIITVDAYPANYDESTDVAREELDSGARPALANSVENMEQYDTVYLGYPLWWGTIPMPVATFLESYDFSGKTIIPFCTHEGSGLGSSEEHIASLVSNATLLKGFEVSGNQADGAQDSIVEWMRGLGRVD